MARFLSASLAFRRPRLSYNSGLTFFGFLVKLVGQMGYFLIIARTLGPHDYGVVATVVAVLTIVGCFNGWGGDHLLIKNVSVARERFGDYFGNALIMMVITAPVVALLAGGITWCAIGVSVSAFAAFAVAELIFARINAIAVGAFMAFERGGDLFLMNAGFSLLRLATCIVALLVSPHLDVRAWALWYVGGAAIGGTISLLFVIRRLGRPRWYLARSEIWNGFHFCLYYTADAALRDLDKPLVAYFAGTGAAGVYTAAYRFIDAASAPMRALVASIYARFFQHGHQGVDKSIAFAFKVLPVILIYTGIAGVLLAAGSDLIPMIMGEKFRDTAPVVSRLAILPMLTALTAVAGDILTSIGQQRTRAMVISVLSFAPVLLCWFLIPRYGVNGATVAAVLNALLISSVTWGFVYASSKAASHPAAVPTAI